MDLIGAKGRLLWLALKWGCGVTSIAVMSVLMWRGEWTAFALFGLILYGFHQIEKLRNKIEILEQYRRRAERRELDEKSAELYRLHSRLRAPGPTANEMAEVEEETAELRRLHSKLQALAPDGNEIPGANGTVALKLRA
jgi:hypothetical protein